VAGNKCSAHVHCDLTASTFCRDSIISECWLIRHGPNYHRRHSDEHNKPRRLSARPSCDRDDFCIIWLPSADVKIGCWDRDIETERERRREEDQFREILPDVCCSNLINAGCRKIGRANFDKKTLRITSLFDIAEHASHTTRKSFIRELFISTARC